MIALGAISVAGAASAETRTLKLLNLHTREKAEITFKKNGRYDPAGLKKANQFLRDWRRNEPTKMDPRLLDLVWESYKSSGSRDYIHVVCGYRSPGTNSMLRSRSKGVAEKSQHMLGKAMDFYIPDVKLAKLRAIGLRAQMGGVGYYPRSGSPFVHMDVGNVRHWPKMSRKELVAVFPNGKTLHVPSDGKPLPGYEQALASYKSRKKDGVTALALASGGGGKTRSGGLLAALFGGGADDEEDSAQETVAVAAAPAKPSRSVKSVAANTETVAATPGRIQIVPPEQAAPDDVVPVVAEEPVEQTPEQIIAALPARSIPLPVFAPRPKADVGAETAVAAAEAAPGQVPFGMAQDETTQETVALAAADPEAIDQSVEVANVPVPGWRPDHQAATEPTLMAMASAAPDQTIADDVAAAIAAGVPLPSSRPDVPTVELAALPEADIKGDQIAAAVRSNNERLAMLSEINKPALAAALTADAEPRLAIPAGARTTRKSARASARDLKPAAKPQIVAAQPAASRWAFSSDYVPAVTAGTDAPDVARKIVRAAPAEVYSSGFQQNVAVADAGRFSGKAISFMPVARFVTN